MLKLPYSGKGWQGESLVNLVNRPQLAKLKPFKLVLTINNLLADLYRIVGKFGKFGKSSMICQTKTIQINTYN